MWQCTVCMRGHGALSLSNWLEIHVKFWKMSCVLLLSWALVLMSGIDFWQHIVGFIDKITLGKAY